MKEPKKKRRKKNVIDLKVEPFPFRRAPELEGKVIFPPEKRAKADAFFKKFGFPPYE